MLPVIPGEASVPARVPVSWLLVEFAATWPADRVRLGDVVAVLGDRAFGLLLLLFALPNVVPSPFIGQSGLFGVPMVFFSIQFVIGMPRPWIPSWLAERSVATADFVSAVSKVVPWLRRVERLLRPRLAWTCGAFAERVLAGLFLILSVILALPIPLVNIMPAIAIALMALGLIEHDGLAIGAGVGMAVASIIAAMAVVGSAVGALLYFLQTAF